MYHSISEIEGEITPEKSDLRFDPQKRLFEMIMIFDFKICMIFQIHLETCFENDLST